MIVVKNYFYTLSFSLLSWCFKELFLSFDFLLVKICWAESTLGTSYNQQVMKLLFSYLLLLCKHRQSNLLFVDCLCKYDDILFVFSFVEFAQRFFLQPKIIGASSVNIV